MTRAAAAAFLKDIERIGREPNAILEDLPWKEIRPRLIYDEASSITPRQMRAVARYERRRRAKDGWFNWYVNRGRMGLSPTKSELRRVSWRRAH